MLQLIKDTLKFMLGRVNHPIYQRELEGWSFIRPWRKLQKGCLPIIGVVVFAIIGVGCCCGGAVGLGIVEDTPDSGFWVVLISIAAGILFGIYQAGELILWLAGLLATALSATAISAEIEAQTFALIRLTPIQVREIVLSKLGAIFQQLRMPVIITMLTRIITVICIILVGIGMAVFARIAAVPNAPFIPSIPGSPVINIVAVLSGLLLVVFCIIYYLLQPAFSVMMYSIFGLFASSLSKTRANGLVGAIGIRLILWIAGYITSQVIPYGFSLLAFPFYTIPALSIWLENASVNQPGGLVLIGVLFSFIAWLLMIAIPLAVMLIFIGLTIRRTRRLPYGI